jgi:hypothetical protein
VQLGLVLGIAGPVRKAGKTVDWLRGIRHEFSRSSRPQSARIVSGPRDLDAVLASSERPLFGALVADALDDESMVFDAEAVGSSDFVTKPDNFIAGKFDQLSTLGAVQVVVFGVAVVEFVHASTVEFEAMEETCVDEFLEGSINGGTRDVVVRAFGGELIDKQIGIEMLVSVEDLFEQELFLGGVPESAGL